ncbi:MAG: DNA primase [Candidatus Spechtbacterales bacterium]
MSDNQVEEIKSRLDLAEVIRGYMKLEKSGTNLRGLCPFHHEKTPSFFASPTRQLWKCFGCALGGDMFTFIQTIEGVDFKEALKTLADKAGVALRSYDPRVRGEKARLYEICEKASQFFEKQLYSSSLGQEALLYLQSRGINDESIKKFRVGLAPYTRESLARFLREQGYSPVEIFKAGVSIQSAANYYDRFRSRVMFPIADLNGQIIGFGGRVFFAKNQVRDPKLAKYINTPQTLLYDKSRTLYGLDKAKLKIREQDSCILVEGYTDVIMAHQAGTENVLSVSGTALTEQQLDIVRRYTENLITLFDMDIAGDTATKRGIDMALKKGFNIKVITLPEGKDPAEIIQKSERKWKKAIERTLSICDFYFETALARFDKKTPEGMKNISRVLLPMIKQIPNRIEQSFWVQKLASELICPEVVVWQDLEKVEVLSSSPAWPKPLPGAPIEPRVKTKSDILYERMILLAMKDNSCLGAVKKGDATFFDEKLLSARVFFEIYSRRAGAISQHDFLNGFNDEEKEYVNGLLFAEEIFPTFSEDSDFGLEFDACLDSLRRIVLKEKLYILEQEMKRGAQDLTTLEKFQKISIELAKL